MIDRDAYLKDPCGTCSIPFWKAVRLTPLGHIHIVHERGFCPEEWINAADEPYFRLKHDLVGLKQPVVPVGFRVRPATLAEFSTHISQCYANLRLAVEEAERYQKHPVYCADLWLAVEDCQTGAIVATGIAELDRELGEGVLEWIQVLKEYSGRGLGSFVVNELFWRMRGITKFVTVSGQVNNPTCPEALYRKCGFTGADVWHVLSGIKNRV